MIIGVDFDGTCVKHEYPKVGEEIGAVPVLKALVENGHQIILFTMRSHKREGAASDSELGYGEEKQVTTPTDVLQDAIDWFAKHKIPLFGINENPTQKSWTASPKPYCHIYIDDAALGVPLKYGYGWENSFWVPLGRPYVDWEEVRNILIERKLIK